MHQIPFHKPYYDGADEQALIEAIRSARLVGDGPRTAEATELLARMLDVPHVLLTPSCSHALELAMMALRIGPGDEVIVPSFTFVSSTNCILRQGGKVVFADIRPDTLTIDPEDLSRRLTPQTKAVITVIYAGISPDMEVILDLTRGRGIAVVEDAAQGIRATYRGRAAGTTGDIGCYSFHETKNYSTGEGGAFSTGREEIARAAEIIREKGTNRRHFLLGLVDKYTWVDIGSSYLPPDHTGALLISQLAKQDMVQKRRREIHDRYMEALAPLADNDRLTLPTVPAWVGTNYHIFYVLFRDETMRNRALTFFRNHGVGTTFHYLPLHLSKVGLGLGYRAGDFPVTESASARLMRLPIYPELTADEQEYVITTMREFLAS